MEAPHMIPPFSAKPRWIFNAMKTPPATWGIVGPKGEGAQRSAAAASDPTTIEGGRGDVSAEKRWFLLEFGNGSMDDQWMINGWLMDG